MKEVKEYMENPALGCKVGKAYQIMLSQLSKALEYAGLKISTSEYLVLRAIYYKEGLQQCDIADLVGKDKAAICRCVSALEKKRLVSTQCVSHKCLRVFLTEKSRELEPLIMEVATSRHKALSEITSPDELELFNQILDKIISSR